MANADVDVVRLVSYRRGLAALLEMPTSTGAIYQAAWQPSTSGPWTMSTTTTASGPLLSASVTGSGGFSILTGRRGGALTAAYAEPAARTWVRLANLPANTATVSVSGAWIDALAVHADSFIDYRLTAGRWVAAQTIDVPVPIGSSG